MNTEMNGKAIDYIDLDPAWTQGGSPERIVACDGCTLVDARLSAWVERIAALGDSVFPLDAEAIGRAIMTQHTSKGQP